jgi:hypothetical protein
MNMRPLIVAKSEQEAADTLIKYAVEHPFSLKDLIEIRGNPATAAGNNPHRSVVLPFGYRCVFTIEEQPIGWVRHLSVSVLEPRRMPNVPAVEAIMKLFHFRGRLEDCVVDLEQIDGDGSEAVNVMELANTSEFEPELWRRYEQIESED